MRDVLDDDANRMRPLSLIMVATSTILSGMIIYNTMFAQPMTGRIGASANIATGASTHVDIVAPADVSNTVIFKYDASVEEVQRELLAIGQFKGMVDGVNGQKTKIAIQAYQQEAGLPITGEITPELVNHIRYTHKLKAAAEYTGSINPAPVVAAAPTFSQEAATPAAQAAKAAPAVSPKLKKTSQNAQILMAQKALMEKGYSVGDVNGQMSDNTRSAILQYQMDNGLAMDGEVDLPLLSALTSN